jgi:hypothetical protein
MLEGRKLRGDAVPLPVQLTDIDVFGGWRRGRGDCVSVGIQRGERNDLQQEGDRDEQCLHKLHHRLEIDFNPRERRKSVEEKLRSYTDGASVLTTNPSS